MTPFSGVAVVLYWVFNCTVNGETLTISFFQGRRVRRQLLERYFGSEAVHGGPLKVESEKDDLHPDEGKSCFWNIFY